MPIDTQRGSVSLDLAAAASLIFDVLADPQGHVRLDGSGMLVATSDARRLTAVGDELIEWDVASADHHKALGHVYGYELEVLPDGGTRVTSYCDWSGLNPKLRDRMSFPVVPVEMMAQTMDNLAALVVG